LRTPTKTKARLKPPASSPGKIARLVEPSQSDIDDDAENEALGLRRDASHADRHGGVPTVHRIPDDVEFPGCLIETEEQHVTGRDDDVGQPDRRRGERGETDVETGHDLVGGGERPARPGRQAGGRDLQRIRPAVDRRGHNRDRRRGVEVVVEPGLPGDGRDAVLKAGQRNGSRHI